MHLSKSTHVASVESTSLHPHVHANTYAHKSRCVCACGVDAFEQPELALSEHVIRQGQKHEVDGRNWARLATKLATPGSSIKIVAFGGSVTVGYRMCNTSYPEMFVGWLQKAFPGVQFSLVNLARRATAATFAALCLVQDLPEDADLVLIEYSVNGYGG